MISNFEQNYLNLVNDVKTNGNYKEGRNGHTYSLFGKSLEIDSLTKGEFPVLTSRKMFTKGILGEFAAFLRGPKNLQDFKDQGCNYWDLWAKEDGSLNVDYGNSWLDFNGVNQLEAVINTLKTNPNDRRMLISGWNPAKLAELSLPCCHLLYQWYVNSKTNELEMLWYQRSADVLVGVPSDVVVAAAWNVSMAKETGFNPGKVTMIFGDTHIYENQLSDLDQYLEQSKSAPSSPNYTINQNSNFTNFVADDLVLVNYNHMPTIKFALSK